MTTRTVRNPVHAQKTGVASADRTLSVLSAFRGGEASLSLAELARRTGLYKSTVLRLTISLERAGYLMRGLNGQFAIGGEVARLAEIHNDTQDLPRAVRPALEFLAKETEETASFWVPHKGGRLCLMRARSPLNLRMVLQAGTERPLDGSSAAQVLALEVPANAEARRAIKPIYTSNRGTPHVASMSVPVFGQEGVLGSLTLSGPESRLHPGRANDLGPLVLSVSRDLSRKLGGHIPESR